MSLKTTPDPSKRSQASHLYRRAAALLIGAVSILVASGALGSIPPLTPPSAAPPSIGFQGQGADRLSVEREIVLLSPQGGSGRPAHPDL